MRKRLAWLALIMLFSYLFPVYADEEPVVLYNANVTMNYKTSYTNIYAEMDLDSKVLTTYYAGRTLLVTHIYPYWVEIKYKDGVGYVVRQRVDIGSPLNVRNTPPYGVEVNGFYTIAENDLIIRADKDEKAEILSILTRGAKISFIGMEDGWAKLIYQRQYGYIDSRTMTNVHRVNQNAEEPENINEPIAIFTSYYSDNATRINNLARCCQRMNRVMKPKQTLDFNNSVGPFRAEYGYMEAPVLIDGVSKPGYGGGSCQVSSTLYNASLQLPGITVLERHAHGASGAAYLPHGVDASSGNANFIIRNDYPFPVRIEGTLHDFALCIAIYHQEDVQ